MIDGVELDPEKPELARDGPNAHSTPQLCPQDSGTVFPCFVVAVVVLFCFVLLVFVGCS